MLHGHGDDIKNCGQKIIANFSSNVYGATDLSALREFLLSKMDCISKYPEAEPLSLEAALAKSLKINPDEVCVTSGSTEAIYLIAQTFGGTKSYVMQPTFSEYEDACRMHRHSVKSIYTLDSIDDDADFVWLCNPNNPTGTVTDIKQLSEQINRFPSVCFVIDQSYEAFVQKPLFNASAIVSKPNVILLHSMTKRYAVPGLRLGFMTASPLILSRIRPFRMPWSVNALAIEAGFYFLKNNSPLQPPLENLLAETARLRQEIAALKIADVWETDTHFFLVRLRFGKAAALKKYLLEKHGLLIRNASNFAGLDDTYIRISTQTPYENNLLINALAEWKNSFSF